MRVRYSDSRGECIQRFKVGHMGIPGAQSLVVGQFDQGWSAFLMRCLAGLLEIDRKEVRSEFSENGFVR